MGKFFTKIIINKSCPWYKRLWIKTKVYSNQAWKAVLLVFDLLIFYPMQIEWKHHYRWERVVFHPTKDQCRRLNLEDREYPGCVAYILYDGKYAVYAATCCDLKSYNQETLDDIAELFFKNMNGYIERHKTFLLCSYYDRWRYRAKTFLDW
jgi:hypothetical protein